MKKLKTKTDLIMYYATVKHHSVIGYWDEVKGATTLQGAMRQTVKEYGKGYHGHVIHLVECEAIDIETGRINDLPTWTRVIGPGNHRWQEPN